LQGKKPQNTQKGLSSSWGTRGCVSLYLFVKWHHTCGRNNTNSTIYHVTRGGGGGVVGVGARGNIFTSEPSSISLIPSPEHTARSP